jgi:pSer/pThr/pTyr-binding forkhead associated (FHA) protein
MALVTLRALDGPDRGKVFAKLPTPLTIGREDGNPVQLNDDRVSRFHLKIQEDDAQLVVTDLESTNGTKLNGEAVQLSVLRHGDILSLGRSVLLCGSREEIAERLATLRVTDLTNGIPLTAEDLDQVAPALMLDFELAWAKDPEARQMLHTLLPPDLPAHLSPGQAAQLAEVLQFLHLRIRGLLNSVKVNPRGDRVTLDQRQWQNFVDIDARLASFLRAIGEPEV